MRSDPGDLTTRALIRDNALRLFAEAGPERVTVRQIAAAAGVSPALVVHHFGSKDGLCAAVDRHVLAGFDEMLGALTAPGAPEFGDPQAPGSLAELFGRQLPPDSPVPAYLSRLLLSGGQAGRDLFVRLYELSRVTLARLAEAGQAVPGRDPAVRAAFLLVNDLAVLLLRDHITAVIGTDPLAATGMARWAPEVLAVYAGGLTGPVPGTDDVAEGDR